MPVIDNNTLLAINFSDNDIVDICGNTILTNTTTQQPTLDSTNKKYGTTSAYFDGSKGVFIPYDSSFDFGTGDFTIDFWWKQPTSGSIYTNDGVCAFGQVPSGAMIVQINDSQFNIGVSYQGYQTTINTNCRFTDGEFHHFAIQRGSGLVWFFIDGVLRGTSQNTTSYNFSSSVPIGICNQQAGGSHNGIIGNINGYRISNVARYTGNFTPPTSPWTVNPGVNQIFYLSGTNNLYGNSSGALNLLTSTYSSLTAAQKEAILNDSNNSSNTLLSSSVLAEISPFKIIETAVNERQLYKMSGQLNPVVITPTDLISTSNFNSITSINVTSSVTSGNIKFAITTDLTNYYRYDFTNSEWVTCSDVVENGMSLLEINSLSSTELSSLDLTGGIGFKQAFISIDTDANISVSNISAVLSLNGTWKSAINGTDYEVYYPSKTAIEVKFLANGDYIVNYPVTNSPNNDGGD